MLNGRVNDSSPRRRLPSFSLLPLRFVLCSVRGWRQPKIVGEIRALIALYVGPAATTDAATLPHRNSATLRSDASHGMKQLKLQLKLHWPNVDRQIQFKLRTLCIVHMYVGTTAPRLLTERNLLNGELQCGTSLTVAHSEPGYQDIPSVNKGDQHLQK